MEELGWVGARVLATQLENAYDIRGVLVLETLAYVDTRPHTLKLESMSIPGTLYQRQWRRMQERNWAAVFTLVLYQRSAASLAATFGVSLEVFCGPGNYILVRDPGDLPLIGFFLRKLASGLVRQFHRSDHVPFWEMGIPAVQITDGANFSNPHYHQTHDTPSTLDFDRLTGITGTVAMTVGALAGTCQSK
jgi:Zn-dependent M28 family amino/carboxypeptidase